MLRILEIGYWIASAIAIVYLTFATAFSKDPENDPGKNESGEKNDGDNR